MYKKASLRKCTRAPKERKRIFTVKITIIPVALIDQFLHFYVTVSFNLCICIFKYLFNMFHEFSNCWTKDMMFFPC